MGRRIEHLALPVAGLALGGLALVGCGPRSSDIIAVDGSSTVYPISEAVAEQFQRTGKGRVTIGVSGTGGGFEKLCHGELSVSGASRPIRASEVELCERGRVETIELPVAYDGIAVVVHPDNSWVDHLDVADLKRIWEPAAQGTVRRWSDVRSSWPDTELHLFGPGVDSGTYDYFTKAIVGTEHQSRGDFTSSEDDNVLVQGVANDVGALGFFGYAYYLHNEERLRLVPVDGGPGPVAPSPATIADGSYYPLTRPVFIYVSRRAADLPSVDAFVDSYLADGPGLIPEIGYVPLSEAAYALVRERFSTRTTGSIFGGEGSKIGASVEHTLTES